MAGLEPQTPQAITSQFNIINQQCSLWKACLTQANANPASESNLSDVISTHFIQALNFDPLYPIDQSLMFQFTPYRQLLPNSVSSDDVARAYYFARSLLVYFKKQKKRTLLG
ncbi:unnamed protein product [Prunus brigantina]